MPHRFILWAANVNPDDLKDWQAEFWKDPPDFAQGKQRSPLSNQEEIDKHIAQMVKHRQERKE